MSQEFLRLDLYENQLQAGVSPISGVYAIVMDWNDNALVLGGGAYTLQAFLLANQNVDAITLLQHAQRTRYWSTDLAVSAITMPDTPQGYEYTIEFWEHVGPGSYDRTIDQLVATRNFKWLSNGIVDDLFSGGGDQWVAQLSLSYDSSTQTATFTAWLEHNGELISNPVSCEVYWYDRSDTIINHHVDSSPDTQGQFMWSQTPLALTPDICTFASVAITDANSVVHTSGVAINTWD